MSDTDQVKSEIPAPYLTNEPVLQGWFTLDEKTPHLLGSRCSDCGTYYFPKLMTFCRNPACTGEIFEEVELSRTGTLWSYTSASYQPPPPYVASEPFQPFGLAAVELEREKMVVLGQLATGVDIAALKVGQSMELMLEPLDDSKLTWKWRPADSLSPLADTRLPSPASGRGAGGEGA